MTLEPGPEEIKQRDRYGAIRRKTFGDIASPVVIPLRKPPTPRKALPKAKLPPKVRKVRKQERTEWIPAGQRMLEQFCDWAGFSEVEICGGRGSKEIAQARHFFMWLVRRDTGMSLAQIGRLLGGRGHSAVCHGIAAHLECVAAGEFGAGGEITFVLSEEIIMMPGPNAVAFNKSLDVAIANARQHTCEVRSFHASKAIEALIRCGFLKIGEGKFHVEQPDGEGA